jgi:hypothetical protein
MAASSAERLEAILARVMTAPDPAAALQKAARDKRLPARLRQALSACDLDGVRLTALLIAKLRFERLLRASEQAEWLFRRDPAAFGELFERYHRSVPPTAFFPAAEAALFQQFLSTLSSR